MRRVLPFFAVLCVFGYVLIFSPPVEAYYSNMNASIVIGQTDFISSGANQSRGTAGADTLNTPWHTFTDGSKLIVSDSFNSRELVFNKIPTSNGASADVVVGQSTFSGASGNQGGSANANTLKFPIQVGMGGGKMFVIDDLNVRLLIYNSIPTVSNASADVVIGQSNMTNTSTGLSATRFSDPWGVFYDNQTGKLFMTDQHNNRILVYNKIPTSNDVAADAVVGQSDMVTKNNSPLHDPDGVIVANGKIIVTVSRTNRVLIYNSIPTSSVVNPDVVIGQPNLSASLANQGQANPSANTLNFPRSVAWDGKRLFIVDQDNNRILVYDGIPTVNNAAADVVIGQPDFASSGANQGQANPSANTLNSPIGVNAIDGKLFISDTLNNRVLIYNDVVSTPEINIDTPFENIGGGKLRVHGNVILGEKGRYVMKTIQANVNGQGYSNVTNFPGGRDNNATSTIYDFYDDFEPWAGIAPKDKYDSSLGYTISLDARSFNLDEDKYFYFQPFLLNSIKQVGSTDSFPSFSFTVNKTIRSEMNANLSKYEVWVKGEDDLQFRKLIGDIPVNFDFVAKSINNIHFLDYLNKSPNYSGEYEDKDKLVTYDDATARVSVKSKTNSLSSGKYLVVVKAVNTFGHAQITNQMDVEVGEKAEIKPLVSTVVTKHVVIPDQTTSPFSVYNVIPSPSPSPVPAATPPTVKHCFLFFCW